MNKLLVKILLLVLCFAMAISCFGGCKSKENNEITSSNTSNATTAENENNNSSTNEPSSDPYSEEYDGDEDDWNDEDNGDNSGNNNWSDPEGGTDPGVIEDEDEYTTSNAVVENSKTPIMTDYRGFGSVIYEMYTYMPYINKQNEFTEEQAQAQFNRMQEIGIDYIRSDYNTYMTYNKDTGSYKDFDTDYFKAFCKEAKELKKRDIEISITTGWSLHALTDNSSSIDSKHIYVEGDWNKTLSNWNDWMTASLLKFRALGLTNITGMILFTEPGKCGWKEDYRYDNFEAWIDCARTLDTSLKSLGIRGDYQFIGPNQAYHSSTGQETMMEYMLKNADQYIDVYTSHDYLKATNADDEVFYDMAENAFYNPFIKVMKKYKSDKPFWIDEWNVAQSGYTQSHRDAPWLGTQLGVCATAIMEFGIQNSILWSFYSQQWPNNTNSGGEFTDGIQMCGIAYSLNFSTIPTTQYYAFTLLSKYLSTTDTVYHVEYDTILGMYFAYAENDEGDVTIIVVNAYTEPQKFNLDFEKSLGGKTLYRHLYNPTTCKANGKLQILPADRAYSPVKNKLVDIIPPGGLTVYTTVK